MVSKKDFETAYRKFSPAKCELFYIKNISVTSLSQKIWPVLLIFLGLVIPFFVTVIMSVLHFHHCLVTVTTSFYVFVLCLFGIYGMIIWHKRIRRMRNICNELNITKAQYEEIVKKYYYENYYPDIKDYIYSILPK